MSFVAVEFGNFMEDCFKNIDVLVDGALLEEAVELDCNVQEGLYS